MPKIQFADLPRGVWHHLLQRVDERRISVGDLQALQAWVRTSPFAPEGDWYKDFGSFILRRMSRIFLRVGLLTSLGLHFAVKRGSIAKSVGFKFGLGEFIFADDAQR